MAGDRSRDLKFSLVSDLAKFDLDEGADALDKVGRSAQDAGRKLTDLDDDARKGTRSLERVGDDARDTARRVDDAFDTIARASRRSATRVDDSTDRMESSLGDVRDEARDTGREMAASFDGTGEGLLDAVQEFAANAGASFGPIAAGFSIVAGSLLGIFRADKERLQEEVEDLVEYMRDAGGRMTEEAIEARILNMDPGELEDLRELADAVNITGVTYGELARAKAGDAEAQDRLNDALDKAAERYANLNDEAGNIDGVAELYRARIKDVRADLAEWTGTTELAQQAIEDYALATGSSLAQVQEHVATAGGAWDDLRGNMERGIAAPVKVKAPSASDLARIRQDMTAGIGTLVIPVKPGQSPYANTAANSRYRW